MASCCFVASAPDNISSRCFACDSADNTSSRRFEYSVAVGVVYGPGYGVAVGVVYGPVSVGHIPFYVVQILQDIFLLYAFQMCSLWWSLPYTLQIHTICC